jgi:hypothetical protein
VPTVAGFLYPAVVLDAWSPKIVGWSMANHLRTWLVRPDAPNKAASATACADAGRCSHA